MNEYIYKSFSDKFESYKKREELVNSIRYFNDIDFAVMDPTNKGHLELAYVKNIYSNSDRNPYLVNMNPNIRFPYCKPFYSEKEVNNNLGYPVSLMNLAYNTQTPL